MLFRRVKAHIQKEDWFAVFIDFVIVVAGVYIGIQLGNWNSARADKIAYEQALERFDLEIQDNLKTLDQLDTDFSAYLKTVSTAFDTLLTCEDSPENTEIINRGITAISGTYGMRLRHGALRELTQSSRLLSQQTLEERRALTDIQYYFDLVEREANYIETLPLEKPVQNNLILSLGSPIYRESNYLGADFSRTHRPLILNVPISEACKNDQLIKAFYTWERWQQVLPALSRQIRDELIKAQSTFNM